MLNETLFTWLAQASLSGVPVGRLRRHTTTLAARMENAVRVRVHLPSRQDLALRYAEGSAPAPVAPTAQQGKSNGKGELRTSELDKTWGKVLKKGGAGRRTTALRCECGAGGSGSMVNSILILDPERLVFIDEIAANTKWRALTVARHGASDAVLRSSMDIGRRQLSPPVCARTVCCAVCPGWSLDGDAFLAYVEQLLARSLRLGDAVIMDNLPAYKVHCVREAIQAVGASLLYLPPNSPHSTRSKGPFPN